MRPQYRTRRDRQLRRPCRGTDDTASRGVAPLHLEAHRSTRPPGQPAAPLVPPRHGAQASRAPCPIRRPSGHQVPGSPWKTMRCTFGGMSGSSA